MSAEDIEKGIHTLTAVGLGNMSAFMEINSKLQDYKTEDDKVYKQTILGTMRELYQALLQSIFNEAQKKYGPIKDLESIIPTILQNIKSASANITKSSSNPLTRFLKRKLIQTLGYNETSGIRLNIVEIIGDTKVCINQLMNTLESGFDIAEVSKQLQEIDKNLEKIKKPMSVLATMYEGYFLKTRKTRKKLQDPDNDQFTDYLLRRKIRRDIGKGIL